MALIQAVKQGHVRGIKLLISNGDTLSLKSNVLGTTALIEACKFDDKETAKKMIKVLLKNGAILGDRDYLGRNALHWACLHGNVEISNTLLSSHAPTEQIDLAMTDYEGNSILHFAVKTGKCSFIRHVCKLYARYRVTDWSRNKDGFSAAELAVNLGHKQCAVMVQDVTSSDEVTDTPVSSVSGSMLIQEDARSIRPDQDRIPKSTQKYLELPLLEPGRLPQKNQTRKAPNKHRTDKRSDRTQETNIVPLSSLERKLSEEIIGKISYRNLLVDMNWMQAIQHSPSYRQGVDERVRLQRMELAAKQVSGTGGVSNSNKDYLARKAKQKKRNQTNVPRFKAHRKKAKEDINDAHNNEIRKPKKD